MREQARLQAALKAARFYRASGPGQVFGYLATAMLLALVLVTLFDRVDAPREPASTAEGGDVVFILFVGLTTLCGISNFQVNCGACPIEWKRFERNAASQYDSPLAHWLFVCGRDVLVVTSGATPYFLATFAGCEMGPMSRLAPFLPSRTTASQARRWSASSAGTPDFSRSASQAAKSARCGGGGGGSPSSSELPASLSRAFFGGGA